MTRAFAIWALGLLSLGCTIDGYPLQVGGDGDGGVKPGAADARRVDGSTGQNGGPDAAPRPDGTLIPGCTPESESCNDADDDCDGVVDNGFDLQHDPRNCGSCGHACSRPGTSGTCSAGECSYSCLPGFHDRDGNPLNGCEYACIPTHGGTEQCDGIDNDCDTLIDEDFDLSSSVENCGACNHVCVALHATAVCNAGHCDYDRQKGCEPPYTDITDAIVGCEYLCQVSPPAAVESRCDNIDENCNGQVDEGAPGGGESCGSDIGECSAGTTQCVAGAIMCVNAVGPQAELCDGKDNDCDGQTDEGYDKTGDPRHCGPGCAVCQLPNAVAKCVPGTSGLGECAVAACLAGYVDKDGVASNGCEYACILTGGEVCDGLDNDCDGAIDEELTPPPGICATRGACAGVTPTCSKGPAGCDQTTAWRCAYPASAEKDACGNLLPQETLCDGVDGDCDGTVDDAFPNRGQPCSDGKIGACASSGSFQCNDAGTGTTCVITSPGQQPAANDATCDGRDDDCDGQLDEDAASQSVVVGSFRVDVYEASRPDASATSEGVMIHRACSEPNRIPWRNVTQPEAAAACAAAGKRLCTATEWQQACAGAQNLSYPYGASYSATSCNGADRIDGPNDVVLPTGALATCTGTAGTIDMSGNVKEWTATSAGTGLFRIRGGAFDNVAPGLTCQFDFVAAAGDYQFGNLGFRCCDAL